MTGVIHEHQKSYDEALKYLKASLEIWQKHPDADNPEALNCANISIVYLKKKEYDPAIEYGTRAYEISCSEVGETHPQTFRFLGLVYKARVRKFFARNLKRFTSLFKK